MTLFKVIAKDANGKRITKTERGHKKSIVERMKAEGYKLVEVKHYNSDKRYAF